MGFGLVVRFTARDEAAAAAFDALAAETLKGIRESEPGTLVYINHSLPNEPTVRIFYELYANRAAFDTHETQPHVRRFLTEREQYLTSTEVTFLRDIAGKGIPEDGAQGQ